LLLVWRTNHLWPYTRGSFGGRPRTPRWWRMGLYRLHPAATNTTSELYTLPGDGVRCILLYYCV